MADNMTTDEALVRGEESKASNSNTTHQAQCVQSKEIKERKKRSRAWQHFGPFVDKEGNKKSKCKYCSQVFFADSRKNGTTAMLTHLSTCLKMPKNVDKTQSQIGFQPIDGGVAGDVAVISWKFDQELSRKALCSMVIVDELPFKFVEKEGFRNFMQVTQPHFKIPSRTTVTRDCFKLFDEEKQKLKRSFREAQQRVCLTTDTWTSLQRINYMCITAHWIDSEWIMHKRIINFCPISSHKGEDMANEVGKCLRDWGLDRIFTITVDNASSNDVTVKELSKVFTKRGTNFMNGEHLHVRCMAHVINLIVQDGLKETSKSIERVRLAVRYIRQSPARCKRFQECCEDVDVNCKKSLILDVSTRWNSTYLMLNRAIEYENVFSSYSERDNGLLYYLRFVEYENELAPGVLLSDDWSQVKKIVHFLRIFYDLTREVSGSLYVTSNFHFLKICEVSCYLKQLISNGDDDLLGKIASSMRGKFDKYWGTPKKMNKMIFISCVLDPRHKLVSVGYALQMMFGKEEGLILEKEVDDYMNKLFGEYVQFHSKDKGKGSQYSSSLSSSSSGNFSSQPSSVGSTIQSMGSLGSFMDNLMKHKAGKGIAVKTELQKYLGEENEVESNDFNILSWWKINSPRFPILAEMARDVLAIPISSVASECAFSTGGRILDSFRSSLTPKLVQTLICLQDWIRSESRPVTVEEDLDILEQLEQDLANTSVVDD